MRCAVNVEISLGAAFVVRDLSASGLGQDFRAAARQRVEARGDQLLQNLLVGLAVKVREERNLDGREAFEMHVGTDPFEPAQELRVVVPRQVRMESVDQM